MSQPDVFTPAEVVALNNYQRSGQFHPFTCGGNRTDERHADGEGILVATVRGWICPFCDYTQTWAHDFMKTYREIPQTTSPLDPRPRPRTKADERLDRAIEATLNEGNCWE